MNILTVMDLALKLALLVPLVIAAVGVCRNPAAFSTAGIRAMWQRIFSKRVLVILLAVLYFAATCMVNYTTNDALPTLQIKMNYEEAAKGENPNKTYFSASKILSNEILEQVIADCGLSISVEELAECLNLRSAFDEVKIDADSDLRIATQYKVSCSEELLKLGVEPAVVMDRLAKVYEQDFLNRYTENISILDITFEDMDGVDYLDSVEYLRVKAEKLSNLISNYSYDNPAFRMADTGETFESLARKISHFMDIDLDRYHAYLLENGLSNEPARYAAQMDYENLLLNRDYEKDMAAYHVRLEAIEIYDEQMAQIVLVPTTDEYQRFYMSRTRIGVDDFADEADLALENATEAQTSILHNTYAKAQVSGAAVHAAHFNKADAMLEELKLELLELADQSKQISQQFITEKRNGYMTVGIEEKDMMGLLDTKQCILQSALFAAVLCLALGLMQDRSKKAR